MASLIEATGESIPTDGLVCAQGTIYGTTGEVPHVQDLKCSENVWGRYLQISKTGGRMDLAEVAVKYYAAGDYINILSYETFQLSLHSKEGIRMKYKVRDSSDVTLVKR